MSQNKLVIAVLILILGIFATSVAVGELSSEDSGGSDEERAESFSKEQPPSWTLFIKEALGYFAEPVRIPCRKKPPNNSKLLCAGLPLDKDIRIPSDPDSTFRTATLRLIEGKAEIVYKDRTPKAKGLELNEQRIELPNSENRKPRENSLVVFEKGGTLRISCEGDESCEVAQK